MHLFYTDEEFDYAGLLRPGVPFLCDQHMELAELPNKYLLYLATVRGRTRSKNTWRAYASHLYEFLSFAEENSFVWQEAETQTISTWRDSMLERGCSRSTVNQRLRALGSFYEWLSHEDPAIKSPFMKEKVRARRNNGFLSHLSARGNETLASIFTVQQPSAPPKFLPLEQAIKFVNSLRPNTLRLMGYLALLAGLRREEIVCLSYHVLPNPCGHDINKSIPMILDSTKTITKGQKTRTVMLPYGLAVRLWNYFCEEWPRLNEIHTAKHKVKNERLFLSAYGDPYSIRYLNNSFKKNSKSSGIECSPHMLRHTFGTYELLRISSAVGDSKALLWVRDRMGHSSVSTTEIYIHSSDLLRHSKVDGYQTEILRKFADGD